MKVEINNLKTKARLLSESMHQFIFDFQTKEGIEEMLGWLLFWFVCLFGVPLTFTKKKDDILSKLDQVANEANATTAQENVEWTSKDLALIITGKTLEFILQKQRGNKEMEEKFVR